MGKWGYYRKNYQPEMGHWSKFLEADRARARRVDNGDEMNHMGNYSGELGLAEVGEWKWAGLGMFGLMDSEGGRNVREEGRGIPEGRDWKSEGGRDREEGQNEGNKEQGDRQEEGMGQNWEEGMNQNWEVGMKVEHEGIHGQDYCKGMKKKKDCCNCPFDVYVWCSIEVFCTCVCQT